MNVLVTGGAGYVGSRLVAHLLARGYRVIVLDRLLYGGEPLLSLSAFSELSVEVGDVRDQAALRRATQGVEAVVHLAAVAGEAACAVDAEFSWSVNHDAVVGMLQAAREARIPRFVFVSTCSNYGVTEPNAEVDEEVGLNPMSDYAKAKVGAERAVLAADGVPAVTVLRLATICGVGARMRFDLLVNEMARDAALGREIEIYAPAAWRPFLHIDDAAEAVWRVLEADTAAVGRQVFNVVGENHRKADLLRIARALYPELRAVVTDRRSDRRDYRVSGQRFARTLGARPSRGVADAFREVAEAVRAGWFGDPDWKGHSALPIGGAFPH